MEGNIFTRALEGVKHVRSDEGQILTMPFLDLCKILLPLIDKFGSQLSCIKADVSSNIMKLESKYASDPSKYNDLCTLAKEEVELKIAKSSSSCTNALVWLNRAMDFMVQLFRNLLEHPEWSLTEACTNSYKKTLKKWHGWMAISTFKVLIKFAPDRKKFMCSIDGRSEINADIEKLCGTFASVLEENHKFLASVGVDDIKAP